jgi:glutamate decarboxylase
MFIPSLARRRSASSFPAKAAPKHEFPQEGIKRLAAYQLVHDELLLHVNSRQNLATFCQTGVEPEVRQLMTAHGRVFGKEHD